MTKQEQIEEYIKKPFEIGDEVIYKTIYDKAVTVQEGKKKDNKWVTKLIPTEFITSATIKDINEDIITIIVNQYQSIPAEIGKDYFQILEVPKESLQYITKHIGADPFVTQDWNARINFYQSDLDQVLWRIGYDRREKTFKHNNIESVIIPELDWNPTIINEQGEEVEYQRPFVWTLEEKQLLIDSIYNNIEIGKIVLRCRSWDWIENRIKENKIEHTAFKQIVDGKQRCKTILEFITNNFSDSLGNYWDDLSSNAQRKFFSFRYVTYGQLGETATDKDVLQTFMCINHTGKPMSPEHLEFVKSIKL